MIEIFDIEMTVFDMTITKESELKVRMKYYLQYDELTEFRFLYAVN